jgi:hypothetical protein
VAVVSANGSPVGTRSLSLTRFESSATAETVSLVPAPTAPPALPNPTRPAGADEDRRALAALAGTVKLQTNSQDGRTVVDNRALGGAVFKPDPANYEALALPDLRRIALAYDEARFVVTNTRKQGWPPRGTGPMEEYLVRRDAYEKHLKDGVERADAAYQKAEQAHLCRSGERWEYHPDGRVPLSCWLRRGFQ